MNYIKTLFSGCLWKSQTLIGDSGELQENPTENPTTLFNCSMNNTNVCQQGKQKKLRAIERKNKKFLTTCKQCGHYRYARCNSKRIINIDYPYEHSPKGGCPVDEEHRIIPGEKYRRVCKCEVCVVAANKFFHTTQEYKKKNQFSYPRTKSQEMKWKEMKRLGWYCRAGLYFQPSERKYGTGMSADEAFQNC